MKGQKILIVAVIAALVVALGAFTNVFADDDDSTFSVTNKTDRDVVVEVYGRADIPYGGIEGDGIENDADDDSVTRIFTVPAFGSDDILLDNDDTYYYKYFACGNIVDGVLDMDEDISLTINACGFRKTIMQVKNHLGELVDLDLDGYDDYSYDIEPGLTIVEVYSGENTYSYNACGEEITGIIDVDESGKTQFFMRSCEWYDHPAREFGALNPVNFVIVNHASFPMILSLIGPTNYLITVEPGENRVQLVAGTYSYSYYIDYETITGSFFVRPNGNGRVMFSPSYTIDNGFLDTEVE